MDFRLNNISKISLFLFAFAIAVTLVSWSVIPHTLEKRWLFFPDRKNGTVMQESRFLPLVDDQQKALGFLLNALVQGPSDITLGRVVPKNSQIKAAFIHGSEAVIEFDPGVQAPDALVALSGKDRMRWVNKIVRYNFPFISKVIILIGGRESTF